MLNLVIPAIWYIHRLHLFWMTSLSGICMCEQSCEKIERLIWLILFAAKEKIFFFFWLVVGFLLYTLVSSPSPLVSVCYTICKSVYWCSFIFGVCE